MRVSGSLRGTAFCCGRKEALDHLPGFGHLLVAAIRLPTRARRGLLIAGMAEGSSVITFVRLSFRALYRREFGLWFNVISSIKSLASGITAMLTDQRFSRR